MKRPPYLKQGDCIAMVAPSFGVTTEPYATRYEAAKKNLMRLGYSIDEGPNVHRADGVVASASPEERAQEIMDALSGDFPLVLSVGGGELMNEMVPFLDFKKIRSLSPKWYMGFSDNTWLTFLLTTLCDWETIYGPCAPSFYERPLRAGQLDAIKMLRGKREFWGYPKWEKPNFAKQSEPKKERPPLWKARYNSPKIITPFAYQAPMKGMLLGGCLDILLCICGTYLDQVKAFCKKQRTGVIWYLEACDLNVLSIRRGLTQLKEAGWFDTATGFLIGRPLAAYEDNYMGVDRIRAVTDVLEEWDVPILLDVDLGHLAPALPFRNGAMATISYEKENIHIVYDK